MTENQIQLLISAGKLPANQVCLELRQTHISWIIICQDYVYKIKKPIKLSFLDFSTLAKRKYYCRQELTLNQRLTNNMYLDVYPITLNQGVYSMVPGPGVVVDFALVMQRLDNNREMSKLLMNGKVKKSDIGKIARKLADFHQTTEIIKGKVTPELLIEDFNDLLQVQPFVRDHMGQAACVQLNNVISLIERFINNNMKLILKRDKEQFIRDCHGDLHSGNIFLLDHPVIFDCIEFNEHFRQIDILNELAFFCMDLEFHLRTDLSVYFMKKYNSYFRVIRNKHEEQLFLFYKLYRANVKMKVNAIKTREADDPEELQSRLGLFKRYFELFMEYSKLLQETIKGQRHPSVSLSDT